MRMRQVTANQRQKGKGRFLPLWRPTRTWRTQAGLTNDPRLLPCWLQGQCSDHD